MTRFIVLAASAAVLATAFVAQTASAYTRETQTLSVSTRGIDLDNRVEAARFYLKLKGAAESVCNSHFDSLGTRLSDQQCARDALDRAVRDVNAPLVTALNTNAGGMQYASNAR